jgi:hypothetical protein
MHRFGGMQEEGEIPRLEKLEADLAATWPEWPMPTNTTLPRQA